MILLTFSSLFGSIRKNIYRKENRTKPELQKQKYNSDPVFEEKKLTQVQERKKLRKPDEKVQDINRQKENSKKGALAL